MKRKLIIAATATISIISLQASGQTRVVRTTRDSVVVRPLGFLSSPQPPREVTVVSVPPVRVGFSAQQVCGYTDWSSAAIELPKQLLTKEYWNNVGAQLGQAATNLALSVTHALPSMLACNVSPTFCNVMNHAQTLAQFETKFTFDSCAALDSLANNENLQSEGLRQCVQTLTSQGRSPSEARESCILRDWNPDDKAPSKDTRAANVARVNSTSHTSDSIAKAVCRERSVQGYGNKANAYSVSELACALSATLPGITVDARASVRNAGSFRSSTETLYVQEKRRVSNYIVELVDLMKQVRFGEGPYRSTGPLPPEKVITHQDVQRKLGNINGRNVWALATNQEPLKSCMAETARAGRTSAEVEASCRVGLIPPVFRPAIEGSDPTLLVHPAMVIELVDLIPRQSAAEAFAEGGQFAFLVEQLSQSTSYVKASDVINYSIRKTLDACHTDPELASRAAQKDCEGRIALLQSESESLAKRREVDAHWMRSQEYFYLGLNQAKRGMLNLPEGAPIRNEASREIPLPGDIK